MKTVLAAAAILSFIFITNCTKPETPVPDNSPQFEGGKGGNFNLVFYSKKDGKAISSRMFLKFAADKAPADTSLYDEKMNTMVEPGFGPHTHFNGLKKGTYFIWAKATNAETDTVIVLSDSSASDQEIVLHLK